METEGQNTATIPEDIGSRQNKVVDYGNIKT